MGWIQGGRVTAQVNKRLGWLDQNRLHYKAVQAFAGWVQKEHITVNQVLW